MVYTTRVAMKRA